MPSPSPPRSHPACEERLQFITTYGPDGGVQTSLTSLPPPPPPNIFGAAAAARRAREEVTALGLDEKSVSAQAGLHHEPVSLPPFLHRSAQLEPISRRNHFLFAH